MSEPKAKKLFLMWELWNALAADGAANNELPPDDLSVFTALTNHAEIRKIIVSEE